MADTGVVGPEGGMEGKGPDTELEDAQKEMLLGLQDAQKQVKDSLDYAQGQAAGGVDKAKDAMGMGEPTKADKAKATVDDVGEKGIEGAKATIDKGSEALDTARGGK